VALEPVALTEAMMQALRVEWQAARGGPLPDAGAEDRRLLFAAVARGLLTQLAAEQDSLVRDVELRTEGSTSPVRYEVDALDLRIEGV
jgi:hypothetical protein